MVPHILARRDIHNNIQLFNLLTAQNVTGCCKEKPGAWSYLLIQLGLSIEQHWNSVSGEFIYCSRTKDITYNPVWLGQLYPPENYSKHPQMEFCFSAVQGYQYTGSDFSPLDFYLCFFSLWQMRWEKMEEERECFEAEMRRRMEKRDSLAWCNACQCLCALCSTGQWFLSLWGQALKDAHIWTNVDPRPSL